MLAAAHNLAKFLFLHLFNCSLMYTEKHKQMIEERNQRNEANSSMEESAIDRNVDFAPDFQQKGTGNFSG